MTDLSRCVWTSRRVRARTAAQKAMYQSVRAHRRFARARITTASQNSVRPLVGWAAEARALAEVWAKRKAATAAIHNFAHAGLVWLTTGKSGTVVQLA